MNYMDNVQKDDLLSRFGDGSGVKSQTRKPENQNNVLTLKQGETVFRVLPPMFSCVPRNIWAAFYARHWVVCNNGARMPVVCTKVYDQKTQQYLDTCQFCKSDEPKKKLVDQTYFALQSKKEELESKKNKVSEEDLILVQDELDAAKEAYSVARSQFQPLERKFWINALTQENDVKLVALPKTVYEALVGKKERGEKVRKGGLFDKLLRTQQLDAVGVSGGVWVVVNRTGSDQFTTEYNVSVLTELEETEVKGQKKKVEVLKEAPLSNDQLVTCLKFGKDLNTVFDGLKLSMEEQTRFLESGNDSEILLDVLRSKRPIVNQDLV